MLMVLCTLFIHKNIIPTHLSEEKKNILSLACLHGKNDQTTRIEDLLISNLLAHVRLLLLHVLHTLLRFHLHAIFPHLIDPGDVRLIHI